MYDSRISWLFCRGGVKKGELVPEHVVQPCLIHRRFIHKTTGISGIRHKQQASLPYRFIYFHSRVFLWFVAWTIETDLLLIGLLEESEIMAYYKNCIVSYLTVIFLFCMAGSSANAATLNVIDNQLHGASGVIVGGSSYDVQFVNTCAEAYGVCSPSAVLLFDNKADADLASQALLVQVFLDGVRGPFDTSPDRTFGIESTRGGAIVTFYKIDTSDGDGFASTVINQPQNDDLFYPGSVWRDYDRFFEEHQFAYAKWTVSTVPLPAAFPLYGAGIAILGFVGWRRQRRAN